MHLQKKLHHGLEHIACLLTTDTGDALSSPHVARWVNSMTKYCYKYNYFTIISASIVYYFYCMYKVSWDVFKYYKDL